MSSQNRGAYVSDMDRNSATQLNQQQIREKIQKYILQFTTFSKQSLLILICIKVAQVPLGKISNKIYFIAHISKYKIIISYSSFINADYIHTLSLICILYNPSETTGIFTLHHLVWPLHPHPHIILPPLLALIQQASTHTS